MAEPVIKTVVFPPRPPLTCWLVTKSQLRPFRALDRKGHFLFHQSAKWSFQLALTLQRPWVQA